MVAIGNLRKTIRCTNQERKIVRETGRVGANWHKRGCTVEARDTRNRKPK